MRRSALVLKPNKCCAPISGTPFRRCVVSNRVCFTKTLGLQGIAWHTAQPQGFCNSLRALLRQHQIGTIIAFTVSIGSIDSVYACGELVQLATPSEQGERSFL